MSEFNVFFTQQYYHSAVSWSYLQKTTIMILWHMQIYSERLYNGYSCHYNSQFNKPAHFNQIAHFILTDPEKTQYIGDLIHRNPVLK